MLDLNTTAFVLGVSFPPAAFDRSKRPFPVHEEAVWAERYDTYWKECLADAGILGLESFFYGSCSLRADAFDDAVLRKLLEVRIEDFKRTYGSVKHQGDPNDFRIHSLDGGVYVMQEGGLLLGPQCCTALNDAVGWASLERIPEGEQETLWIGHPWVVVRHRPDELWLTSYTEEDQLADSDFVYRIALADYRRKAAALLAEIRHLRIRIECVLADMGAPNAQALAQRLLPVWEDA